MTDAPTVPLETALRLDLLEGETETGAEFAVEIVDADSVDEDAYVNGKYGGTKRYYTAEGEYDGEGTYVFGVVVTAEKYSDEAEVTLVRKLAPGEEEELNVTRLEAATSDAFDYR